MLGRYAVKWQVRRLTCR